MFERLRSWLQQIRFNTLTDLAKHAMIVQGDPIASRSLSNDYYLEQYFKSSNEFKYGGIRPEYFKERLSVYVQAILQTGNLTQLGNVCQQIQ